jgi:hypothetical protein
MLCTFEAHSLWVKRDYDITGYEGVRKGEMRMLSWDWSRLIRDEESSPHAYVRLVVFHHRGRIRVAGDQPIAARAARRIGAGTVGCGGGVFAVWRLVLERRLAAPEVAA